MITQAQFDGLISFVFNTGGRGWIVKGPLYGYVRNGQWEKAAHYVRTRAATSGGRRLRGLVARRNFEADIIQYGKTQGKYFVDGKATIMTGLSYDETKNTDDLYNVSGGTIDNAATGRTIIYTICSGDTLSRIAQLHKTTVSHLVRLNPQINDPNRITTGDVLNVPLN